VTEKLGDGGQDAAGPVRADVYKYVDEEGKTHFVDSRSKVPGSVASDPVEPGEGIVNELDDGASAVRGRAGTAGTVGSRPSARPSAERASSCRLVFRERKNREEGQNLVYYGKVENRGNGIARIIKVSLIDYDEADEIMDRVTVPLVPSTLGPGASGEFEIEISKIERDRTKGSLEFKKSAFEAELARCD